jgi:hypothetical protein
MSHDYSDALVAVAMAGTLKARINNLRATMATVAVRLHDNDEARQVLASALELALLDDDRAEANL